MPTTHAVGQPREIYQIKVSLLGTDPPIWRRLLVPADLTLEQLHDVLQLAIGWENCHLHEFRIGQQRFGKPDPMERTFGGPRTASARTARLFSVLNGAGAKAVYTYDFGDSWEHEVVVEKCLASEPGRAYPACLAGDGTDRPKIAAAYLGSTICWKRSAIRSMRSTKICWTGLAAASIRSHFPLMQSINGCKGSFALFGSKLSSALRLNRNALSR